MSYYLLFVELAAATFISLILITANTAFLFAMHVEREVRWIWAITIAVAAGISAWNWNSLLADIKHCEYIALHLRVAVAPPDRLVIDSVCASSTQLHAALQLALILMLISALVWNRRHNRSAADPNRP